MKVVILAGGFGTRISEESISKPKPMIEIGQMPILWHIMKNYSFYGFNDFIICAGYKQHIIKEWFSNYFIHTSDITFDFSKQNQVLVHKKNTEPWKVSIIDTGLNTQTGGRLKRIKYLIGAERFMLTYGDAVANMNIKDLLTFHQSHGKIGTVSVHNFGQNKGVLDIDDGKVTSFREKSRMDGNLINIGYMIFEHNFLDLILEDSVILEKEPMDSLIKQNQLMAFTHNGFWQCMDTSNERQQLELLWNSNKAQWKIWDN